MYLSVALNDRFLPHKISQLSFKTVILIYCKNHSGNGRGEGKGRGCPCECHEVICGSKVVAVHTRS